MTDICVHGLGYIGLPTAAMFANHGYDVVGFDVDEDIRRMLRSGDVHIQEPELQSFVDEAISTGHLTVSADVPAADVHAICVPTPLDEETKSPGLQYVTAAGEAISQVLRPGDTVLLESTVPPGTTRTTLCPVLERSGLTAGVDFSVAHCPETVLPGNVITELRQNDRIVGGIDAQSADVAARLYESFVEGDIHTTDDATTAEFVKLVQNTFRDTNIALANELAKVAHDYDIDSREAIRLANEHPRVNVHHPGPGVGGHCLPIDPWFLGHDSDSLELVEHARDVNERMTDYVVEWLTEALDGLDGTKIAVLGVAYKGGVGDTRMSPGLSLARELQGATDGSELQGATDRPDRAVTPDGGTSEVDVAVHDPHVTDQTLDLVPLEDALDGADGLVVTTDHAAFESIDPQRARELMDGQVVVDTHALLPTEEWAASGFDVRTI